MRKIRMITILRTTEDPVVDKKGSVKTMKTAHWFPCKVNAAVPLDHRMCH